MACETSGEKADLENADMTESEFSIMLIERLLRLLTPEQRNQFYSEDPIEVGRATHAYDADLGEKTDQ